MKKIIFTILISLFLISPAFAWDHDEIRDDFPSGISPTNTYAKMGYLDCEYYASVKSLTVDPTGVSDSRAGIIACVDDAADSNMVALLPTNSGRYKVSDQLLFEQPLCTYGGTLRPCMSFYDNKYYYTQAPRLVGPSSGARPTIVLANSATGFNNTGSPKSIVKAINTIADNVGFDMHFADINIENGTGNAGAIGLEWRGAQGTSAQNVKVYLSNGGFAGFWINNLTDPYINLEVVGGSYGTYQNSGDTATIVGFKATGQTSACVRNISAGLVLAGFYLEPGSGGVGITSDGAIFQGTNLIDGIIKVPYGTTPAIQNAGAPYYARNVWVSNTGGIIKSGTSSTVASSGYGKWDKISEYYYPSTKTASVVVNDVTYYYAGTKVVDAVKSTSTLSTISNDVAEPDVNSIWAIHIPPALPWFQDAGVVNLIDDGGATGDGRVDDTAAFQALDDYEKVFIPRGAYRISNKITFTNSNAKVFGPHGFVTTIGACRSDANGANDSPEDWQCWEPTSHNHMLATSNNADGTATFANLALRVPSKYSASWVGALDWQHGRNSETISLSLQTLSALASSGTVDEYTQARKLLYIHGNGGGRHYNTLAHFGTSDNNCTNDANFRGVYVYNTAEPTTLYMPNPEHTDVGSDNPEMEAEDSTYVRVLGIKTEAHGDIFRFTNVTNAMELGLLIQTGSKPFIGFYDCTNVVGTSYPRNKSYFGTDCCNIARYTSSVRQSPYMDSFDVGLLQYGTFDDSVFGTISDEEPNPGGPPAGDFIAEWNMESGALTTEDAGTSDQALTNNGSITSESVGTEMDPPGFGTHGTDNLNGTSQYFSVSNADYVTAGGPWITGEPAGTLFIGIQTNTTVPTLAYVAAKYNTSSERTIGLRASPPGVYIGYNSGDSYENYAMTSGLAASSKYVLVYVVDDTDKSYRVEVYDVGTASWWTPLVGNYTNSMSLDAVADFTIGSRVGGGYFNGKIYFAHLYATAFDQSTLREMVASGELPISGGTMTDWYWSDCDSKAEITTEKTMFNQQTVCFQTVWDQAQVWADGQLSNLGTPFTMDDDSVVYATPTGWGIQTGIWEWRLEVTASKVCKGGLKLGTVSDMVQNRVSGTTTIKNASGDEVDYDFPDLEPDTKMIVIGTPVTSVIPKQF